MSNVKNNQYHIWENYNHTHELQIEKTMDDNEIINNKIKYAKIKLEEITEQLNNLNSKIENILNNL